MSSSIKDIDLVYRQYIQSNGHRPENATYLRQFSVEINNPILYCAAKSFLENNEFKVVKKVFFSWNMEVFSVTVTEKDKYTISDLKNDVVSCIEDASSAHLIFLLDSEEVEDFDMDIIQYFDVFNKTSIHFEVKQQTNLYKNSMTASSDDDSGYYDDYFDADLY